jgi:hypothetical protein
MKKSHDDELDSQLVNASDPPSLKPLRGRHVSNKKNV